MAELQAVSDMVVAVLFPPAMLHDHHDANLEELLTHVIVYLSLDGLRRPDCRVVRLFDPAWLPMLLEGSPTIAFLMCKAIEGGSESQSAWGLVYTLYNTRTHDIGKAVMRRKPLASKQEHPGIVARFMEHVRCVLRPDSISADARKPRYRLLRMGQGSRSIGAFLRFTPVLSVPMADHAYAAESICIKLENPHGNMVDDAAERAHKGLATTTSCRVKAARRRPSSWRRTRPAPWTSIWAHEETKHLSSRRLSPPPSRWPGVLGMQGTFSDMHRAQQTQTFLETSQSGPLWIYSMPRMGRLATHWGSKHPQVELPQSWPRHRRASCLYDLAANLTTLVHFSARRFAVGRVIDWLLRDNHLPPRCIAAIAIPPRIWLRRIHELRHAVRVALEQWQCQPAAEWVRGHLRVRKAPEERWIGKCAANRAFAAMTAESFAHWPSEALARAARVPSLVASPGAWKLPIQMTSETLRDRLSDIGAHGVHDITFLHGSPPRASGP